MTLLAVYGAIGVVCLVLALLESGNEPDDAFYSALSKRPVRRVMVPLLAGAMVMVFWPAALFIQLRNMLRRRAERPVVFRVTRKDLIRKISIAEVEQRERAFDPLGAVPDVPFGFLNPAWLAFKAQLGARQTVFAFSTRWTHGRKTEQRTGYVARRWGRLGPYVLTACRVIDQD